jgi:hypothetical protein
MAGGWLPAAEARFVRRLRRPQHPKGGNMTLRVVAACAAIVALAACSSTEPTGIGPLRVVRSGSGPTLRIVNSTCNAGSCVAFDIRGQPDDFPVVPATPSGGWLDLGQIASSSSCLVFPDSLIFTLIAVGQSASDTMVSTWSASDSISLTAVQPLANIVSGSADFVPGTAAGWTLTLSAGVSSPVLTPSQRCVP